MMGGEGTEPMASDELEARALLKIERATHEVEQAAARLTELENARDDLVAQTRTTFGLSYDRLAKACGLRRQTLQERLQRRANR